MNAVVHELVHATAQGRFEVFRQSLPWSVARAQQGAGGFIMLDFGAEQSRDPITADPQFDWHLWIYMCDWDLFKKGSRILWRRESDNTLAGTVLSQLEGEQLVAIEFDKEDDCFAFEFSGGFRLNVDPDFYDYDAASDLFMLFEHNKADCLSYSPMRRFYRAA